MKFDSKASRFLSIIRSFFRLPIIIGLFVLCVGGGYLYWHFNYSESAMISELSEQDQAEYYRWKNEPIGIDPSKIDVEPSTPEFQRDLDNFLTAWNEIEDHYAKNESRILQITSLQVEPNEEDAEMLAGFSEAINALEILVDNEQYDLNRANLGTMNLVNFNFTKFRNISRVCSAASITSTTLGKNKEAFEYLRVIADTSKINAYGTVVSRMVAVMIIGYQVDALSTIDYESLSTEEKVEYLAQLDQSIENFDFVKYDHGRVLIDQVSLVRNMIIAGELDTWPENFESLKGPDLLIYFQPEAVDQPDSVVALLYTLALPGHLKSDDTIAKQLDELIQLRDSITTQTTPQTTPDNEI